jgi:hypothetical protein
VEDRERLRLAGQNGVGDDDVRGQLSPGVETWAADTVLAEHRQVEQVRSGARVGDLPVGQWDPLGEHLHAVDVDKLRATTHTHAYDSTGAYQLSEFKIAAGRQECRESLVADSSGSCHRTIVSPTPGATDSMSAQNPGTPLQDSLTCGDRSFLTSCHLRNSNSCHLLPGAIDVAHRRCRYMPFLR